METTMFALGVLATIMVMLITIIVVGIVKVFKTSKQIKDIYSYIHETERHLSDRLLSIERNMDLRFQESYRDINMIEATTKNALDALDRATKSALEKAAEAKVVSNSYTDKRIDKLIDTYFSMQEVKEQSKKLIKG